MSGLLANTIGTPAECLRVNSEMEYLLWARRILAGTGAAPILKDHVGDQPSAVVNDGRWLVRCACSNACIAHPGGSPDWPNPVAVCAECGTVYRPTFPAKRELAEVVLLARPDVRSRHWEPDTEKVADLIRENKAHDLPSRKAVPDDPHGLDASEWAAVLKRNKALDMPARKAGI